MSQHVPTVESTTRPTDLSERRRTPNQGNLLDPREVGAEVLNVLAELARPADTIAGDESWMDEGVCAQTDPEIFFPEKGESNWQAKRVCAGCTVREQCLEFALANDERFGVWGGLSVRERRKILQGQEEIAS